VTPAEGEPNRERAQTRRTPARSRPAARMNGPQRRKRRGRDEEDEDGSRGAVPIRRHRGHGASAAGDARAVPEAGRAGGEELADSLQHPQPHRRRNHSDLAAHVASGRLRGDQAEGAQGRGRLARVAAGREGPARANQRREPRAVGAAVHQGSAGAGQGAGGLAARADHGAPGAVARRTDEEGRRRRERQTPLRLPARRRAVDE